MQPRNTSLVAVDMILRSGSGIYSEAMKSKALEVTWSSPKRPPSSQTSPRVYFLNSRRLGMHSFDYKPL